MTCFCQWCTKVYILKRRKKSVHTIKINGVQCCLGHIVLQNNLFCFMLKKKMHSGFERLSKDGIIFITSLNKKSSPVFSSQRECVEFITDH